jgi:hypothetical protein
MNKFIFFSILLFTTTYNYIFSQDSDTNELRDKIIIYEIQDFRYNFFKKDTLRYRVETFDSILINYGKPLLKTRLEYLEVSCDSVTIDRKFLLSLRLLNLISDEKYDNGENVRRTTSPWIKRKIKIWIDSLGNRIQSIPDDSLKYAMSPGGAFMPTLIFPFKETYRNINESWLVTSKDTLVENGIPSAVINQSSLFRARKPVDTLNYECTRFSYIKTARGAVNVLTQEQRIRTETTITGSGIMTISRKFNIPVHLFQNSEQKLLIFYPEKDEIPGQHYTSADWTLETFIPSPDRTAPPKPIKPVKANKKKKKK